MAETTNVGKSEAAAAVKVSRRDRDSLAVFPGDSAIRFEEFFTAAQTETAAQLRLPDQIIVSPSAPDKLIALLGSDAGELVIETAAGEDGPKGTGSLPINDLLTNCTRTDLRDGPSLGENEEHE